jgi:hypothetical protein
VSRLNRGRWRAHTALGAAPRNPDGGSIVTVFPVASTPKKVVFLLGAGASADAKIPTMPRMYELFMRDLPQEDREFATERMRRVRHWATKHQRPEEDIEVLLASLERYARLDDDLAIAVSGTVPPEDRDTARRIATDLRSKIREWCVNVQPNDVVYLHPLVQLANVYRTLDIFTLNYDRCIEVAAELTDIPCETGFSPEWNPELLDREGDASAPLIRLHKLHGSVSWYRTDGYRYRHVPVRIGGEAVGVDGSPVYEMLVYPELQKEPDLSPYPNLLARFRTAIAEAAVLVVIGYGFGDEWLSRLVREVRGTNRRLQLVILDPKSQAAKVRSDWPENLVLELRMNLKDALEADRILPVVQSLVTAEEHRRAANSFLPNQRPEALRNFTLAVAELLQIGHERGAWEMVRQARGAIRDAPQSQQSALFYGPQPWIDYAPPFDHPAAKAWWGVGRYHLSALEHGVFVNIGGVGVSDAVQRFREAFPALAPWQPMTIEAEMVQLQEGIARRAHDEGSQQRAVITLAEHLDDLIAIDRLRRQPQNDQVLAELTGRIDAYTERGSSARVLDEVVALMP